MQLGEVSLVPGRVSSWFCWLIDLLLASSFFHRLNVMTCRRFYIAKALRFGFAIPTNNLACIPPREVVTSGRDLPAVGIRHYSTAGVPIGLVEPLAMASVPTDRLAARIGQLICRRSSAAVYISPEDIGHNSLM
jgi:hypothetical protein